MFLYPKNPNDFFDYAAIGFVSSPISLNGKSLVLEIYKNNKRKILQNAAAIRFAEERCLNFDKKRWGF